MLWLKNSLAGSNPSAWCTLAYGDPTGDGPQVYWLAEVKPSPAPNTPPIFRRLPTGLSPWYIGASILVY